MLVRGRKNRHPRQPGSYPDGLIGSFEPIPDLLARVNSRCPKLAILIALHSPHAILETGLRMCHPEKSPHIEAMRSPAVRSLQSMLLSKYREQRACFAYFRRKGQRNFSAVRTCWRRECDSNLHYGFESRNPRRFRNLQAVQHLTRESTGSDWPQIDKKQSIFPLQPTRSREYASTNSTALFRISIVATT
jgi:hypothetical protein